MGQIKYPQLAYYELRQLGGELGAALQAMRERNYGIAEERLRVLFDRYSVCADNYVQWLAEYEKGMSTWDMSVKFD